jgi:predicted nucleic acid-binding protein
VRFVDTNVFVRYLSGEETNLTQIARDVFDPVNGDDTFFTTNDAVIAEVIYVLTSPKLYRLSRNDVVNRLQAVLQLPTCKLESLAIISEAMFIWQHHSKLSFVDALCIASATGHNLELVTFDTALAKIANTARWDLRPQS